MKLLVFRSTWGLVDDSDGQKALSPHRTLETALPALAKLGYDGIEIPLKAILHYGKEKFKELINQCNLKVIVMVFTSGPVAPGMGLAFGGPYDGFTLPSMPGESDKCKIVETHTQVFKEQVIAAQDLGFKPYLINSHSCNDYFTKDMAEKYFKDVVDWCQKNKYVVHHETHRKRALYSPWVSRDLTLPEHLTLVADLSHWINVAETDANDPDLTQVIEDFAPRVKHVHCRVGYDHGPQVPDPREGQWLAYTEGHERWWDAIWKAAEARGDKEVCFTTEFGPPNYQVCDPKSELPLAKVWDVNHWIALRRQARFAQLYGKENTSKLIASETQDEKPLTNPGSSILSKRVGFN